MKNKPFRNYYLLACIGILIASYYPLSMGIRVISDMICDGTVLKENYPKYIIPYTPISIAIIAGVLLMPLCIRLLRKFALVGGGSLATGLFFAVEVLFERKVVITTAETVTTLEDWQMFMCYSPPGGWGETVTTYKTQTAVEILMGEYNPAFKLHFYLISVVLILTVLNCLYGFGQRVKTGDTKRTKALILQSACSVSFLGLCILACFTAFWRDGSIQVSALSAILMIVFFVLFGVTVGVFVGSFLLGKTKAVSVLLPSVVASVMTFLMYVGEMVLMNNHLYCLGNGYLFESIPGIVFAPIDLFVIIASGSITALIFLLLIGRSRKKIGIVIILCLLSAAIISLPVFFPCATQPLDSHTAIPVTVTETVSDLEFSSYQVTADLPITDFSSVSQMLRQRITREWNTYDGMTREQQMLSSHLWGLITIDADSWDECEEKLGFSVNNPLESLSWLDQTGYIGMESAVPDLPCAHIQANARALQETERRLSQIDITAGYHYGKIRITLTATLSAGTESFSKSDGYNGFATYEEKTTVTGSGLPLLVVTANETNNTGYYLADYHSSTAYWVNGNVFYTLRLIGEESEKAEIQTVLDRIVQEI